MTGTNYIKNVAIIGAGGNSGKYITEALLSNGKHVITAITRSDSTTPVPEGVEVMKVDYNNHSSLVEALKGQDALIITLSPFAPPDTQPNLIRAAAEANVPWILPNDWSPDTTNEALVKDVMPFQRGEQTRKLIASVGKSAYISLSTGFWYEWSIAIANAYGFDFANRSVTFFDDGETKITTTTWPQVGRAVASLLSLPIQPEGEDKSRSLQSLKNQVVYVSSFTVSQKDMLDSVLRVTKTSIDDWKITKEPSKERYTQNVQLMMKGDRAGFTKMMYTRVFYPDGCGDVEKSKGTINELLGLPKEDIDEATKRAIARSEEAPYGYDTK